jgi:hypothetical protein
MTLDDFKENYSSVKSQYIKLQKQYLAKEELLLSVKENNIDELLKQALALEKKLRPSMSKRTPTIDSNDTTVRSVKILDPVQEDLQNQIN